VGGYAYFVAVVYVWWVGSDGVLGVGGDSLEGVIFVGGCRGGILSVV
jgi:hypothetical protein